MTDILLDWLNKEIKLSKPITSIQEDFRTGYLYAELLHKLGQIPSLKIFRQSNKDEDIIHNFCRLEKTLLDMHIVLTKTDRNNIIAEKKETAIIYLFKIKQYLSSKLINLDTLKSNKSKELHNIYRSLQFKTENNALIVKKHQVVEQINPNDPSNKIRMKYKHLKLNEDDYKMIHEGEDDLKVFEEYHNEILSLEKGRNNNRNDKEKKEQMNWKTSFNEIKQNKKRLHEESIKELLFYRDATIQYLSQSANDCQNTIKLFNNNLSKLGLDIPGASEVNTGQKISTDIILMRMKELMNQKITAKKEKEKRDRRRLKEELKFAEAIEKKKAQLNTATSNQHIPILSDGIKSGFTLAEKNTDATVSFDVHYSNVFIGDRISFFKTVIPDHNNLRYDLNDNYYSPSREPFDKEAFISSINHLNYESNLRESVMKQTKRSNHYPLMGKITQMIIDITEEAFNYQGNNKATLINEDQWIRWTKRFSKDLSIVEEKEQQREEETNTNIVNYERDLVRITEREENEMFNYVNYLENWNKIVIPNDIKGQKLNLTEFIGDLIKKQGLNNIEEYEPTENEIDILTIPKDACRNIPFGELIETIVDIKYPPQRNNDKPVNRFGYIPIKIALCGYPLSGHRTQAKLMNEAYPNIKIYHITNIINEYMETFERLIKPIEEHPKYKPNKKGLVEQLQQEVNKEREQFAKKEKLIQPYIEAKTNNPDALPLDSVMLNVLISKLNEDFPITESSNDLLIELYSKIAKKKEMIKKIEQLKQEEISTKKPKTKDIQLTQKDIDKLIPELCFGFITVDFPQTKKQCALIEHYFTGFVSEIDKPLTEKNKVLNSFNYSIESQPHLPSLNKLEKSGFDFVIDLSVSSNEIERRYKGIRYDPNTKAYYHLEDNPPKENDKKVSERLIIPPEYSNNKYTLLKEFYERNMNEIRNFYSIFGVNKFNTKTFQVVQSERKQNEIFEEINHKLIDNKMKQIEYEQAESEGMQIESKQIEGEIEQVPPSTNKFSSKIIQFAVPVLESSLINTNILIDTPHYSSHGERKSDKKKISQNLKEFNIITPYLKFSSFNYQYLNECQVYFWFINSQKKDIISYISNLQTKFTHFLSMPSQKADLSAIYVNKFNSFLVEYGSYKNNKKVHEEFSKDIQELNEKLWMMIQTRKSDSVKYLESLKENPYKTSQIEYLYEYTKQLLMIETKKYLISIDVLRQYYDVSHLAFSLHLYSPEDILEEINNDEDFSKRINKLYKNCIKLLYKQDEKIKNLEIKIKQSQSLNETNVSIRKRKKTNLLSSITNMGDREFYFYEEEVKQILKTEKNKYKFRITMIKYFVLNYDRLINKLFDGVLEQLDLWIILSIEAQNNVLNELMFHLNDRLRKGECAKMNFEFDSFDIYKPFDAQEYFYYNDNVLKESDYSYNVKDFKGFYEDVKQYTIAPQIISKNVFIGVVIKKLLLKNKDSIVISKALGSISYHSYANLMKLIEIVIDHSTYDNPYQQETKEIGDELEEKKESLEVIKIETEEGKKDQIENNKDEVKNLEIEIEQEKEQPKYDTYLNISQAFIILALINSKLLGQKEEKELRNELVGKIIKSTQITRETFCQLDFWWEMDEYLQTTKDTEPEKEEKLLSIKNMLFNICKDDNYEEDEINIEKFINFLTFKYSNNNLTNLFHNEYLKDQDDRCTYLSFITKI